MAKYPSIGLDTTYPSLSNGNVSGPLASYAVIARRDGLAARLKRQFESTTSIESSNMA